MIVAGIGSRKGVSAPEVIAAVEAALKAHGLEMDAVSVLATTEFKRNEEAIFEAGRELGLPVVVVEGAVSPTAAPDDVRVKPPHPASAPLGHPLPVGERNASAAEANLATTTGDAAAFETPISQRNEQITGIGDRILLPNGEKVAAKRPDEGVVFHTLTHSDLSQALAGVSSVSEAAALAAAGQGARLLGPRTAVGPVTCALATSGDAA